MFTPNIKPVVSGGVTTTPVLSLSHGHGQTVGDGPVQDEKSMAIIEITIVGYPIASIGVILFFMVFYFVIKSSAPIPIL